MAVSKIKINTVTLKRDTDSIRNALTDIEKKSQQMQTDVTQMNAMWEGDANAAFNKAFQDDIKDLQKIIDSVKSIVGYEENAQKEYDSCESKVSDLVGSISV